MNLMSQVNELTEVQNEEFTLFLEQTFLPIFFEEVKSSSNQTVKINITESMMKFRNPLSQYLVGEGFNLTTLTCGTNPQSCKPFDYRMIKVDTKRLLVEGLTLLISW